MPTKKPRISVTVSEPVVDLLERTAAIQGVSVGSVVRELLEAAQPSLERMLTLLEGAIAMKARAPDEIAEFARALEEAHEAIEPPLLAAIAALDPKEPS